MAGEDICHFFVNSSMLVKNLKVSNFRNLSQREVSFSPATNILYGLNGEGKTNLLEAIFVLCLGRSHRGALESVMLRENEEVYRIEGSIEKEGVAHEVAVAYQKGGRKRITIDKVRVTAAELYGSHCVVSAGPEDSGILSGSPSIRRSFLDMYLSQFSNRYLVHLVDYYKVLAQKNACLRSDDDPTPFNVLLVDVGAKIVRERQAFIEEIRSLAEHLYADISQGGKLSLTYQPSIAPKQGKLKLDEINSAFQTALRQNEEREKITKTALVGPHRDDVLFRIGNYPARTHGSQGEWRTAAIALKLAVYRLLKAGRKTQPILLLDEIFAELDDERAAGLMRALGNFGQLFLTTAVSPPEYLQQDSRRFRIHNGAVHDMN